MKHCFRVFPLVLFLLLLPGCAGKQETAPPGTAMEILAYLAAGQTAPENTVPLEMGSEAFESYLQSYYQLDPALLSDGALCYPKGVNAQELAVLRLETGDAATVAEALQAYAQRRALAFNGYAPEQAAMAESALAAVRGNYAVLLLCPEPEKALEDFEACFQEGWTPPDPPQIFQTQTSAPEEEPVQEAPSQEEEMTQEDQPQQTVLEEETLPEQAEKTQPEETAREDTTQEDAPQEETPQEEAPQGVTPQEEPPQEESPQEEAPQEEAPQEEAPREEAPREEAPREEAPAQDPASEAVELPPDIPWEEDLYDHDAVVAAWHSGDVSGLTPKNLAILQRCQQVIATRITEDMDLAEQERAIHDYMILTANYDTGALSRDTEPSPDNDNPYGLLYNHLGICLGYSGTFQLFMDLLGIECITVPGHSTNHSGEMEDHAWNMVRLDGEWYCVDTTWDDPIGGTPTHRYFNVTSQFLRNNRHIWDETGVPDATSTLYMTPLL